MTDEKIRFGPEHIQHSYQKPNMPLRHCREIFDQVHVSAGRKRVKERYERYLEWYPIQRLMSHILPIAAKDIYTPLD